MPLDSSRWSYSLALGLLVFLTGGLPPARAANTPPPPATPPPPRHRHESPPAHPTTPQGPTHPATLAEINSAIAKAIDYLYKTEKDGNWEPRPPEPAKLSRDGGASEASHYGGFTAICTYALLAAGEDPKEKPQLDAAIKWLMKADLRGTYAVALRAQVWLLIPKSPERDAARDNDAQILLTSVIQKGEHAGFYGYSYVSPGQKSRVVPFGQGGPPADYWFDRSNSQYGVLGVWAAEQAGAEVPEKYWEMVNKAWRSSQSHDGAWTYKDNRSENTFDEPKPTMACAGVASLFITQDYLMRSKRWDPCMGGSFDANIENGLKYVEKHIDKLMDTGNYYGMYGVERIATASGRRYFGTVDWFQSGADYLVRNQDAKSGEFNGEHGPIPCTCFALLFLSRGGAPLMMNKLEYATAPKVSGESERGGEAEGWNERPRDVANLARWTGPRMETFLNWQTVNLTVRADQLHDAPILYVSGNQALNFSEDDKNKLRAFIEQGGMILGAADCGSVAFAKSFEKLGVELFNNKKYDFRQLPVGHLIFTGEQYPSQRWRIHPLVTAMTNGVREIMILLAAGDAGRAWQTDNPLHREFSELGANIFLYSTERQNLRFKGEPFVVIPNATTPSKHIKIARLQTDGNWDPEPGGWARLVAIFHNARGTQLDVEPVKLGTGTLAGYPIAHLTGTGKVTFSEAQRQQLRDFVAKGGTLIVDAAGGDAEFANAIEPELKSIFGKEGEAGMSQPLTMDAPVFSSTGERISTVGYRAYTHRMAVGNLSAARLYGIPAGNRIGVFYSRMDISAGLVGEPVDGIVGYDPASATKLMTNMIEYVAHGPGALADRNAAPALPAGQPQ